MDAPLEGDVIADAPSEMDVADADAPSDSDVAEVDACVPDAAASAVGCADGTREGFVDVNVFPVIAGCSGGFDIPGVVAENPGTAPNCPSVTTYDTVDPACCRRGGNTGPNPEGIGCNVADLCAVGWHVCEGADDIIRHSPGGCTAGTAPGDPPLFFVTRQSSNGCGDCATGNRTDPGCNGAGCTTGCAPTARTTNDVFGCGNFGATSPLIQCGPIDRFSQNLCSGLPGSNWSCQDDGSGLCEAFTIVHLGAAFGGALCCRG
jgi:hypothetical protein